ncbi:hypothetical protein F5Y17DRAFT_451157 [Xylariaceae sp. FL0594]|nr:hypothetical protein F5Y17DRAFT_451157 [Xylariaceae sp. FL0594]
MASLPQESGALDLSVAGVSSTRKPRNSSVFPPLTQPNPSSPSLVSSTAQGRPIALTDDKAADRTTALRELTRSQPLIRRRSANTAMSTSTTGPPNTTSATTSTTAGTYSHPVLVRTYSGPTSSSARRDALVAPRGKPAVPRSAARGRRGFSITLARPRARGKPTGREDARLPPLEDFSFKNILAEIEHDIGPDLDRIADICARSRYSLSNQYEIHVAPHGSGHISGQPPPSPLIFAAAPGPSGGGPTLQAVSIDQDRATSTQGKTITVRRSSVAYGTLETIISCSRSSEEGTSDKRKPAAEIAAQVRGRIPPILDTHAHGVLCGAQVKQGPKTRPALAASIFDRSRAQVHGRLDPLPRRSGTAPGLASGPAVPEMSNGLVSTTVAEGFTRGGTDVHYPVKELGSVSVSTSVAAAAIAIPEDPRDKPGIFSGVRIGIPWASSAGDHSSGTERHPGGRSMSYAEGTLRELLKVAGPRVNQEAKLGPRDG